MRLCVCAVFFFFKFFIRYTWIHSFPLDIVLIDGVIRTQMLRVLPSDREEASLKCCSLHSEFLHLHRLVFVLLCTYFTQSHLFCKHTVSKVSLHKTRMSTAGYKLVSNNFPTGLSNEKLCRSRWQTGALAFVLNFGTVASCLRTFLFWVLQRRLCLAENNTWLVYTSDTVLEPEWTKQTLI